MTINTPSFESLRSRYLRDLRSDDNDTTTDSDNFVRASSVAAIAEGLYAEIKWLHRQIWATEADEDELERHARGRGLVRKAPVTAVGTCLLKGRQGVRVAAGSALRHPQGAVLVTTADAVIDTEESATVRVAASIAGKSFNGLGGKVTVVSPPAGLDSDAVLAEPLAGGSDQESALSLLNRYLELIRHPPAGGNQYDYRRWARDVPGVADAWVYPLRSGLGTVDVAIVGEDGLPTPELIEAVQYAIDRNRPAGGRAGKVFAPKELLVDVSARVTVASGYNLEAMAASGRELISAMFAQLAPGEVLRRSQIEGIITNLPGVIDRELTQPAANVIPGSGQGDAELEWIRLRKFSLEAME